MKKNLEVCRRNWEQGGINCISKNQRTWWGENKTMEKNPSSYLPKLWLRRRSRCENWPGSWPSTCRCRCPRAGRGWSAEPRRAGRPRVGHSGSGTRPPGSAASEPRAWALQPLRTWAGWCLLRKPWPIPSGKGTSVVLQIWKEKPKHNYIAAGNRNCTGQRWQFEPLRAGGRSKEGTTKPMEGWETLQLHLAVFLLPSKSKEEYSTKPLFNEIFHMRNSLCLFSVKHLTHEGRREEVGAWTAQCPDAPTSLGAKPWGPGPSRAREKPTRTRIIE